MQGLQSCSLLHLCSICGRHGQQPVAAHSHAQLFAWMISSQSLDQSWGHTCAVRQADDPPGPGADALDAVDADALPLLVALVAALALNRDGQQVAIHAQVDALLLHPWHVRLDEEFVLLLQQRNGQLKVRDLLCRLVQSRYNAR